MNKKNKRQEINTFAAKEVKSIISQAADETNETREKIDLLPQNYRISKICPKGSLIKVTRTLYEVMHTKKEVFETLEKENIVLILHSLENKIDFSHVIVFIYKENTYMHVSNKILEDFKILIKGTIE